MMQLGSAMELTLRLFAVILLAILLKQMLFRILMAIVTRWANKDDLG
jgi:hypothetical protein